MRQSTLLVAGATLLSFAGCSSTPPERPVGSTSNPIVGGTADTTHQAVMYLHYAPKGSYMGSACTGTLVDVQGAYGYLLTAAHCVLGEPGKPINAKPADFKVVQGDDVQSPTKVYSVVDFKADPLYKASNQSITYDFAMVKVTGMGAGHPDPIPLLTADIDDLAEGSPVEIVGYGISYAGQQQNTKRQRVDNTLAAIPDYLPAVSELLISYEEGGALGGACSGDSGGPVFYTVANKQYVAGVTSYGDENCVQYGVSGRVSAAVEQFIAPYIQGSTGGTQTCAQCQEASTASGGSCAASVLACQQNKSCLALAQCLNGCTDAACNQNCATKNQAGLALYNKIGDCLCDTACSTECASEPACAGSTCGFSFTDATCGQCIDGACCTEEQACADDATCSSCLTATNPPASCNSNVTLTAFDKCASQHCSTQCGLPSGGGGAGGSAGNGGAGGAAGDDTGAAGAGEVGGSDGSGAAGAGSEGTAADGGAGGSPGEDTGSSDEHGGSSGGEASCHVAAPGSSSRAGSFALLAGLAALSVAGRRHGRRRQDR